MKLGNRALLRAGAVGAGLILASTAFAAPAFADTTADLGVKLEGTTLAANAEGKFAAVSLTNAGPSDAVDPLIAIDINDLDASKVAFDESGCSAPEDGVILCGIEGDVIPNGADIDWAFPMTKVPGATGSAGTITVAIEHAGTDPNPANNSVTAEVVLSDESGVDLATYVPDVYQWSPEDGFTTDPIPAGGTSIVYAQVINTGDLIANGLKIELKLPVGTTLTEPEPDCEFSADGRSATCEYSEAVVAPFAGEDSIAEFAWKIKVADDVEGPVALTGGLFTVAAADVVEPEVTKNRKAAAAPAELPEWYKDVDETDNKDDFSVFVAGDTSGGGGGLPVTGPAAAGIAGGGAALLVLGTVLFAASRRRRIVTQA
jgi:hypothetical protein